MSSTSRRNYGPTNQAIHHQGKVRQEHVRARGRGVTRDLCETSLWSCEIYVIGHCQAFLEHSFYYECLQTIPPQVAKGRGKTTFCYNH